MKKLAFLLSLSLVPTQKTEAVITNGKVAAAVAAGAVGTYSLYNWASDPRSLERAVVRGSHLQVRVLLAMGADINARDNQGFTALYVAIEEELSNLVLELLERGANPNLSGFESPLQKAIQTGNEKITALLLGAGAKVGNNLGNGWTPLHYAYFKNQQGTTVMNQPVYPRNQQGIINMLTDGRDVDLKDIEREVSDLIIANRDLI